MALFECTNFTNERNRLKCKIYRLKCEFYRLKCEKYKIKKCQCGPNTLP
jgi:hypothetical protein